MLDLGTFSFSDFSNFVSYSKTLTPTGPSAVGIFNSGSVNTFGGSDWIRSRLDGTITTDGATAAAFQNTGTLQMGFGFNRIDARASFTGIGDIAHSVFGIDNTGGSIETGSWFGWISGYAAARGGLFANAAGIWGGDTGGSISTGWGRDTIFGRARAKTDDGFGDVDGIKNIDINTGSGSDNVIGIGTLHGLGNVDGISNFGHTVDTGPGNDLVKGIGTVFPGLGGDSRADGIAGGTYLTGAGNDRMFGKALVFNPGGGGTYEGTGGIDSADIQTGDGWDFVLGEAIAFAGDDVNGRTDGIDDSRIETGNGHDKIVGRVLSKGGNESRLDSTIGIENTDILTSAGHDIVLGRVTVRAGLDSDLSFSTGIDGGTIDTGDGNDKVVGLTSIHGEDGSELVNGDGIDATGIRTGDGHDLVKGKTQLSGAGLQSVSGDGLNGFDFRNQQYTIDTGDGNDRVIGIGADIAIADPNNFEPDENETSEGIDGYIILLGGGNDFVYARGASAGVKDVDIQGGDGRDTFDLHSGTGTIDGGNHYDTLILNGWSWDFTYTDTGVGEGTIQGGVTDLQVADIELFRFDNGLFTYDDLFV